MNKTIYLAGPINGCTDEECINWREYVKSILGEENTLDPMRRDYRGREEEFTAEIVEGDKSDIDQCTHILAHVDRPSFGTAMEIHHAWERKIPVIVVAPPELKRSPWLIYHSDVIFNTFKEAIEHLENI